MSTRTLGTFLKVLGALAIVIALFLRDDRLARKIPPNARRVVGVRAWSSTGLAIMLTGIVMTWQ